MMLNNTSNAAPMVIDGNDIGEIEDFFYLVSVISKGGGTRRDVEHRVRNIWNSYK